MPCIHSSRAGNYSKCRLPPVVHQAWDTHAYVGPAWHGVSMQWRSWLKFHVLESRMSWNPAFSVFFFFYQLFLRMNRMSMPLNYSRTFLFEVCVLLILLLEAKTWKINTLVLCCMKMNPDESGRLTSDSLKTEYMEVSGTRGDDGKACAPCLGTLQVSAERQSAF